MKFLRLQKMSDTTLLIEVERREFLNPDNDYYQMDGNPRGYCVIINMVNTKEGEKLVEDRKGAEIDQEKLSKLFESYNFTVQVEDLIPIVDQSHEIIEKKLKDIARDIPSNHQCIFLFLMAHGTVARENVRDDQGNIVAHRVEHQFYDVEGIKKSSEYISENFDAIHCPNLAGKPKVFVIQTCFDTEKVNLAPDESEKRLNNSISEDARLVRPNTTKQTEPKTFKACPTYIGLEKVGPAHETSDMLWTHAALEGYRSARDEIKGTILIQSLHKAMIVQRLKMENMYDILTKVLYEVSRNKIDDSYRQQPVIISTLTKTLMFNPGLIKAKAFSEPPLYPRRPKIHKVEGTCIWPVRTDNRDAVKLPDYIVVNSDALNMHLHSGKSLKIIPPKSNNPIDSLIGFKAGISIGQSHKHLVILKKTSGYTASVLNLSLQDDPFWEIQDVQFVISNPLALCEVNNDGYGILCGIEGNGKADFYVFSRRDVLKNPQPAKIEKFEMFYQVKAGDLVVYHVAKIYIASTFLSSVLMFNLASEQIKMITTNRYNGRFNAIDSHLNIPCMVGRDASSTIIADELGIRVFDDKTNNLDHNYEGKNIRHAWYNAEHLVVAEKKNIIERETVNTLPSRPRFTSAFVCTYNTIYNAIWSTGDGGMVFAGTIKSKIIIHIFNDTEITKEITPGEVKGSIAAGLAVFPNEHIIITTHVGDQRNKLWLLNTGENGTCEEDHDFPDNCQPLTLFAINHNSYGVVRNQITKGQTSIEIRNTRTHFVVKLLAIDHGGFTIHDTVCFTPFREFVITNNEEGTVRHYDEDGTLIQSFGEEGGLQDLISIFVDQKDIIYVLCQGGMHYFDKKECKWLRLDSKITGASMGCYDRNHVYILYSGGKTSVTRYNISVPSNSKATNVTPTSIEDIRSEAHTPKESRLISKSSSILDHNDQTRRENTDDNQSRSPVGQNVRPGPSKTAVGRKHSPVRQNVRSRPTAASTKSKSVVGQQTRQKSSKPSPTKDNTQFTGHGSVKIPARGKKTH